MIAYKSKSRTIFMIVLYTLFALLCISILIPFINALAISLSDRMAVAKGQVGLWPKGFNLEAYKKLVGSMQFLRTAVNSVVLTVVNTVLVVMLSLSAAFALAHKYLVGKKVVMYFILITMFFSGGLIPTYLLVNGLGLTNTYLALILPSIVSAFYIIVYKNVIQQLPKELLESAEIDGAGEFRMLFRIVLPLVLPMTMAFAVFSAVAFWNEWFNVLLYIRDQKLWTLQFQLREILISSDLADSSTQKALIDKELIHPQNLKMAALLLTILPIVAVYPFVQKYFIHGQFVGAVKG